jgi:hypothetical protein
LDLGSGGGGWYFHLSLKSYVSTANISGFSRTRSFFLLRPSTFVVGDGRRISSREANLPSALHSDDR